MRLWWLCFKGKTYLMKKKKRHQEVVVDINASKGRYIKKSKCVVNNEV